jgi:hypothetical protein
MAEWKAASQVHDASIRYWKDCVRAALKNGAAQPLPPATEPPPEPQAPRVRLNDVTIEQVAILLATAAPKGLLMVRDELAGFLLGMDAYNAGARSFWLEAYGGRPYRVDRVRHPKPIDVPHLVVAWWGTVQPERLADVMQGADDGLLARFCWFWPEPIRFAKPSRQPAVAFATRALDRLRALEMQDDQTPVLVPMADPAADRVERFGRCMQDKRELTTGLLRSAHGKARGLILRIAHIVEHLWWCARDGFDPPPTRIGDPATEAAVILVQDYILPMAARCYGDAASTQADRNVSTLARWIAQQRDATDRITEIHVRTMQRETRLAGLSDAHVIHTACKALIDAGWLLADPGPVGFQRRGRAAYRINPAVWDALA